MNTKKGKLVDIHLAEVGIYNNFSTTKFLNESYPLEKESRLHNTIKKYQTEIDAFIKENRLPGERWTKILLDAPYYISSKGRMLSIYRDVKFKQYRLNEGAILFVNTSSEHVTLESYMKEAGFDYDYETIVKFFRKTDYPILHWAENILAWVD